MNAFSRKPFVNSEATVLFLSVHKFLPGNDSFVAIQYRENVISEPFLSNGRLLRLHHSGFQPSCQNILLSQIRDSPNLQDQVPIFISARNRVAQLYPQALGSQSQVHVEALLLYLASGWRVRRNIARSRGTVVATTLWEEVWCAVNIIRTHSPCRS
jgi:hypothetical protein